MANDNKDRWGTEQGSIPHLPGTALSGGGPGNATGAASYSTPAPEQTTISWHIGKEAKPLDKGPHRAYFFWKRGDYLVLAEDYSLAELQAHIERQRKNGTVAPEFERALKALASIDARRDNA